MAKILLVEDDLMNRDMLTERLQFRGYQIVTAVDGAQAVRLARTEHPDLILMDMGLPVMNGWQATHWIKSGPDTHSIPIIALTAFTMDEDRRKCLAVGCDEFETKPVEFPRLLAKMSALLERTA
jgi:CheY-like chemotaxis protein